MNAAQRRAADVAAVIVAEGRTVSTGDGALEPSLLRLLQCRAALRIEVRTGMSHSRGSVLAVVNQQGWSVKRTKAGALADLDLVLAAIDGARAVSTAS